MAGLPESEISRPVGTNSSRVKVLYTPEQKTPSEHKKTTVVMIRRSGGEIVQDCDVYIGRAMYMGGWKLPKSKWANPFTVKDSNNSSKLAVKKYHDWLLQQPELLKQLGELRGKVLGCWCKNKPDDPCHGDVLADFAEKGVTVII